MVWKLLVLMIAAILVLAGCVPAANTANWLFNPDLTVFPLTLALAFVALVLIVVDRMWKKLPSDHPAVYRDSATEG
jgi:hypothetical protein